MVAWRLQSVLSTVACRRCFRLVQRAVHVVLLSRRCPGLSAEEDGGGGSSST